MTPASPNNMGKYPLKLCFGYSLCWVDQNLWTPPAISVIVGFQGILHQENKARWAMVMHYFSSYAKEYVDS